MSLVWAQNDDPLEYFKRSASTLLTQPTATFSRTPNNKLTEKLQITHPTFPDAHPEYGEDEYVKNNLAILHVYFEAIQFMRKERSELYGITDFFSNIGGLGGEKKDT